jgi:hypothetical protein
MKQSDVSSFENINWPVSRFEDIVSLEVEGYSVIYSEVCGVKEMLAKASNNIGKKRSLTRDCTLR